MFITVSDQTLQEADTKAGLDGKEMHWRVHLWLTRGKELGRTSRPCCNFLYFSYLDWNEIVLVFDDYDVLFPINKKASWLARKISYIWH